MIVTCWWRSYALIPVTPDDPMPLTKVTSRSSPANTAMITYQESTALLHEPGTPSLDAVHLRKGHMPPRSIGGAMDSRKAFLGQDAIQFGNRSLLGQVEVLG